MERCYYDLKDKNSSTEVLKFVKFAPPKKKLYQLLEISSKFNKVSTYYKKYNFVHNTFKVNYPWIDTQTYRIKKSNNKTIVVLHIINKNSSKTSLTFLYSHGCSQDLGVIYPFLIDLSNFFKVDIISYDYSGYGQSEDVPSKENMTEDILEVSYFITKELKINPKNVILFGHSIGSIPSIKIAVNIKYDWLAVILISPFSGGFCFKKRMNDDPDDYDESCSYLIMYVKCPVLIIHGMKDQVIPHKYSLQMAKRLKNPYQWYPRKADHHNLIINYRYKLFTKLQMFIDSIFSKNSLNDTNESSLLGKYLNKQNPFKIVDIKEEECLIKFFESKNKNNENRVMNEESCIFNHYDKILMKSYYSKMETNIMNRKTGNQTVSTYNNKNTSDYNNQDDENSSYLVELNHMEKTYDILDY